MTRRELIQQLSANIPGLLSAATVATLLSGCVNNKQSKLAPTSNGASSFNSVQLSTLSALSDVIIPTTETPGAKEAQVPAFIETTVLHVFTTPERSKFIHGLSLLNTLCIDRYGDDFPKIPPGEQYQLAAELDEAAKKVQHKALALPKNAILDDKALKLALECFAVLKNLTIFGFCTSEVGATTFLQHKPIPGRFDGCVPLADIGTSWATS